jgi:hypothetical protein
LAESQAFDSNPIHNFVEVLTIYAVSPAERQPMQFLSIFSAHLAGFHDERICFSIASWTVQRNSDNWSIMEQAGSKQTRHWFGPMKKNELEPFIVGRKAQFAKIARQRMAASEEVPMAGEADWCPPGNARHYGVDAGL